MAAPFVGLGTSALQNLFWLPLFFLAIATQTRDSRGAVRLAALVLVLSPTVIHQVVTGTGHLSNAIYVALGLWWLASSGGSPWAATAWGVTVASRANFLWLIPLAGGFLWKREGRCAAIRATTLATLIAACLTLPFYFNDPENFGPLESSERVFRFDRMMPGTGLVILMTMTGVAVVFAARLRTMSDLFRAAAVVQAVPVLAGTVLGTVQNGALDLSYSPYASFFAWFAIAAVAVDSRATPSSDGRRQPLSSGRPFRSGLPR
jgi:hypothetical protein